MPRLAAGVLLLTVSPALAFQRYPVTKLVQQNYWTDAQWDEINAQIVTSAVTSEVKPTKYPESMQRCFKSGMTLGQAYRFMPAPSINCLGGSALQHFYASRNRRLHSSRGGGTEAEASLCRGFLVGVPPGPGAAL